LKYRKRICTVWQVNGWVRRRKIDEYGKKLRELRVFDMIKIFWYSKESESYDVDDFGVLELCDIL